MLLEEVDACPACDNHSFSHLHTCKDYTTSSALFHVKQCDTCGLAITSPRPPVQQAQAYYLSEEYISHTSSSTGIINSIYLIVRRFSLQWKYRLVSKYLHQGPLLDFGCGTGNFLQHCKKNDTTVYGVEPSPEARNKLASKDPIILESVTSLPPIQFNVITMWHVLEHVYPLFETLQDLKNRLTDHGTIFIAVPNWESPDAAHYKEMWAAYDVPRHLWHFSKQSMTTFLTKSGLEIREIIPMKLDAYYVSMLSEKNQMQGKLPISKFLLAIYNGMKSNRNARKTLNYSSLIYIVQKI